MTDPEVKTPARRPVKPAKPRYRVRRTDLDQPDHAGPDAVRPFDTEGPARRYIETNHPRGREVFLQMPDGSREHYSADHEYQGDDGWHEFHPDELD